MPTLGNFLSKRAGAALTCKRWKLTLTYEDTGTGAPTVEEVEVLITPVSRPVMQEAMAAAAERCAASGGDIQQERRFCLMLRSLRDVDDVRKLYVEAKNVETFNTLILDEHLAVFALEYNALILGEYPEIREHAEALITKATEQAAEAFTGGQA